MLKKELKLIIAFYTTSAAMATEKVCKDSGIKGALISAPRNISADCGISYAVEVADKEKIQELLKEKGIEYEKMLEMEV